MSTLLQPDIIVKHLMLYLPRYTDIFSRMVSVNSAEVLDSETIKITTTSAHSLTGTSIVLISNGLLENSIISVVFEQPFAQITVNDIHDFTTPRESDDVQTVEFYGFTDPKWNAAHSLNTVIDGNNILVPIPEGVTILPVLTGNEVLYEDRPRGAKGAWQVNSIISPVEFSIKITDSPPMPVNPIKDLRYNTKSNIVAAYDFKRASELYTKAYSQREGWLFVIMSDVDVSKDRRAESDAIAELYEQDENRLILLQNFSTVVFLDSSESIGGAAAQSLIYGEIFEALLKSLYCFDFSNGKATFKTVFAGHGKTEYNTSYYAHVFDWQVPVMIDAEFGFSEPRDVALRAIDCDFGMFEADSGARIEANTKNLYNRS